MTEHTIGTREQWRDARLRLLAAEKEHTRASDDLARMRQDLPWVRVEKDYQFDTGDGRVSLADLFDGRSQLLVYHFMFGPDYEAGCLSCSAIADGFQGSVAHLAHHDVTLAAVSRAPIAKLLAYRRRMGWTFPWASSYGSEFNYDFNTSFTQEQKSAGAAEYDYRCGGIEAGAVSGFVAAQADACGTDVSTYTLDSPGMSAFLRENGVVYHTYSTYARGLDALWGMYAWLDRAPRGRNEDGLGRPWWSRHDEYDRT